ncbi:MAG TPA: dihydroorotase [Candidatus Thermoplasmatota archaeon]|nr:dihydroorotase [Candidatus Thermoplasmatota archaeon]
MHDLVVKGRLFLPQGTIQRGAFAVRDGRIAALGAHLTGARVVDAGEHLVVPGAIDPHVHFRDPGHPEKEDFASGTKAAALGGVTTVLDMPNTTPPTFTREALDQKKAIAAAKAHVDHGLHLGLDAEGASLPLLPDATSMKIYLGATTGNLLVTDLALVRRALVAAAEAGRTVVVHAESQACLDRHAHLADDSYPSHARARPPVCEAEAIAQLADAARGTGARVHIAHLSTASGLKAIEGTGFTSEVCPHHLLFTQNALAAGGSFKMNPPLRSEEDVRALWSALASGEIACLASDHAPHTPHEKATERAKACPSGVPGVQTLLPVLMPHADRVGLPRLLGASVAAARVFGLASKGALAVGKDADFAIYDMRSPQRVRGSEMASRAGWTPFEGLPAVFPREVFVRGLQLVRDWRFEGIAGTGRFVRP